MNELGGNEFLYADELRRNIEVAEQPLRRLGRAGLLFALREDRSGKTYLRYHLRYARLAGRQVSWHLRGQRNLVPFKNFAAAHTNMMSTAINRFYDGIFAYGPKLTREQAEVALGVSNEILRRHVPNPKDRSSYFGAIHDPEVLARIFYWIIPGNDDTMAQVRSGLDDRAGTLFDEVQQTAVQTLFNVYPVSF